MATIPLSITACREETWMPQTLTPEQGQLLANLVDWIIPATDTPGASQVGVHQFIDQMLTAGLRTQERTIFLNGLVAFEQEARTRFGLPFANCPPAQCRTLLEEHDAEALANIVEGNERPTFFQLLKHLTIWGYYTSEAGATQELRYQHVFVEYRGRVPVEEVGRAWA